MACQKHMLYQRNLNHDELVTDFQHQFYRNQEFENHMFDEFICSIIFVRVRFRSIAILNQTQSTDWVWLSSSEFDRNSVWLSMLGHYK